MIEHNHSPSSFGTLLGRAGSTALRAVNTRVELLAVEWQEERLRLRDLLFWGLAVLFLVNIGALLLSAAIIFLFPENLRVYATFGLAVLYLCGAAGAWFALRAGLRREPFAETIEQAKKDREWLESLK